MYDLSIGAIFNDLEDPVTQILRSRQYSMLHMCHNFNICNVVRQGGILSPFLFVVYNELSLCLRSLKIGCRLSNMIVNHLLFADDAVFFAPSAKGLQQLLDICSKFALSHNVVFNVVKSQCLIVSSRSDFIRRPTFQLSGAPLPYTECYKYTI